MSPLFKMCGSVSLLLLGAAHLGAQNPPAQAPSPPGPLTLWYTKPAGFVYQSRLIQFRSCINDALPIGNAALGALITGETPRELLRLNETSLWSGAVKCSGGDDPKGYGNYLALADLTVMIGSTNPVSGYRRELDLSNARATVSYTQDGVTYRRTYAASYPGGVITARFEADRSGACHGSIHLLDGMQALPVRPARSSSAQKAPSSHVADNSTNAAPADPLAGLRKASVSASSQTLLLRGKLHNGMEYEVQVDVVSKGGRVTARDGALEFNGCDSVDLFIAAGTDYAPDATKGFRGADPHAAVSGRIASALKTGYEGILASQLSDYGSLFDRVSLDLGKSTSQQKAMPTDARRIAASKVTDPELEALLFQYGRYLMIACSRPGGLPANLQGLWNDTDVPPWHCDYHANINVQMNYWAVEVANLPECHLPLFDMIRSQIPCWTEATLRDQGVGTPDGKLTTRGWAVKTGHNLQGGMTFKWDKTANAWYALHFWEHYAFGGDRQYLRDTAYPVMREVCEFWEDHLKTLPDGRLVVPDGWSPEHGPTEDGVNYNQEIVWDLFNNTVQAADVLGGDKEFRNKIAAMRDRLAVPGIGSWGQLLEWMTEKDLTPNPKDPVLDTPNDHHRHTSHLFALYPGRQISLALTPTLAEAARVSLRARGDQGDVREWSFAWRCALYARLHEGNSAEEQIRGFLRTTCPNLFGNHPPMQMDGNFGITAGIAEMLLQSHENGISLLPALPQVWPSGSVGRLRARGGFEVTMTWSGGSLKEAVISSPNGGKTDVLWNGRKISVDLKAGENRTLKPSDFLASAR